jgi:hypothetical protein
VLPEHLNAAFLNLEESKKSNPAFKEVTFPTMDYRFFQGASDGLWGKQLVGNEIVTLFYMDTLHAKYEFQLPGDIPLITLDIGDGPKKLEAMLHTLVIDKNSSTVTLVWRGALEYGGLEQLEVVPYIKQEVRSQESGVRSQKTEDRRQKTEDRR